VQVEPAEASHHPGQCLVVAGHDQLVDQGGGGDVADVPVGLGCGKVVVPV
jgi:hypothetical protein